MDHHHSKICRLWHHEKIFLAICLPIVPLKSIEYGVWGSYYNIPKAIFYLLKGTVAQLAYMSRLGTQLR